MGHLFRSEEMTLCQLFLHTDSAYSCISYLGELGAIQFIDTVQNTNAFQKKFVNEVRRCDEMERKLRFLEKEINLDDIPILNTGENPQAPEPREMIDLETNLETIEDDLKEINKNFEQLKKNFLELVELNYLLQKTKVFFEEGIDAQILQEAESMKEDPETQLGDQSNIKFVAGVINRDRIIGFERMLWRVCRGNVLTKFSDIEVELEDLSTTNKKVAKSVFVVFFPGEQLKIRVNKICEAYHATVYPCTDNLNERKEMVHGVMTRMEELKRVLDQTQSHRHNVLVTAAKHLRIWFIKVRKIKAIYHTLNLFNVNVTDKCMIGECWCPVADMEAIYAALRQGMDKSSGTVQPILNRLGDAVSKKAVPPTFHRVNKFTAAFQSIVDAYGVANYREVNPAPFTVITFPFIFAVMFGDCGHGLIMFLFALALVLKEKKYMAEKSDNEIWNMFFGGRYIILLMGIFSVYTGLIYNDAFSKSLNFGSSWQPSRYDNSTLLGSASLQLDPVDTGIYRGYPYAFGIDPAWQAASNKITFTNSVKMKMSIILGISQMLFGVCLSLFNHAFFKDPLSIIAEFVPQVIFLMSIFGYLIVEIFAKWLMFSAATSKCAPQLLIGLINMFMFRQYNPETDSCADRPFLPHQFYVQSCLVLLAAVCVPWMLVVKPVVLYLRHRRASHASRRRSSNNNLLDGPGYVNDGAEVDHTRKNSDAEHSIIKMDVADRDEDDQQHEEFDLGEVVVHQCIHTIEYCLGCISNTASYLRLWALSLAHAQLSEVLWNMVLRIGLGMNTHLGLLVLFFIFAAWAALTIAVLLLMEGLSAFLHALRLHWVEFQNKFYKGEGYTFAPFTFRNVDSLKMTED